MGRITEGDVKFLMDNLGDIAGLDMVLLREAGFDGDAEPLRGQPPRRPGWIATLKRAIAPSRNPVAAPERRCTDPHPSSPPPSGETSHHPSARHADRPIPQFIR